nr:hypothetical protein Iba_chr04bCG12800 [Ipomoea batatas]
MKPPFSVYDAEQITRTPFETFRKERDDPQSASERSKGAVNTPSITDLHLLNFAENVMATSSHAARSKKKVVVSLQICHRRPHLPDTHDRPSIEEEESSEISLFFSPPLGPSRGLSTCTSSGSVTKVACSGITFGFCIGTVSSSKLNELKAISKSMSSWVKISWVSNGTGM